jgi:CubicO group peptidase (beta-lactamase class C family)
MTRKRLYLLVAALSLGAGDLQLAARQSPEAAAAASRWKATVLTRLSLAGWAKRYCSGIWVSERERLAALNDSVLSSNEAHADYGRGVLRFQVDDSRRIVTASREAVIARARHFGDQGCVILPEGTDEVFFTPRKVVSTLPDASSMPWPTGDRLPDGPMPAGVNPALLEEAIETLFSNPRDLRAAFVVVHKGRIVAERYGSGAHQDMQLESWSMGKSMTATFIGRLIQMGHIRHSDP